MGTISLSGIATSRTALVDREDAPAAFTIYTTLCGETINFLVDTGSAIDPLNIETYRAMKQPPELETPFYPQVFTVDNGTTETIGQFDAIILLEPGETFHDEI